MLLRQPDNGVWPKYGLVAVTLSLKLGQRQCCLARVSDLSPVPPRITMLSEVSVSKTTHAQFIDLNLATLPCEALLDQSKINSKDFARVDLRKHGVVQADVDAGGEGLIKITHAVCRQEEDAGVVLKYPEED